MHSQDDEIIPFEHGKLLYDQAHEPKTFIELSGGHNEYVHENYDRYIEELETFLRAVAQ